MKITLIIFLYIIFYTNCFAQGEINDQERALFFNEISFGASINTSGWDVDYRYAKNINYFKKTLYTLDLSEIKHPKETKSVGQQSYPLSRNFVYGKLNNFYQLRLSYGKQNEIFTERDKGSISVRLIYTVGFNLGVLKPIYYEYRDYNQISNTSTTVYEKFSLGTDKYLISRASYFMGIEEIKIVPGITAKGGITFEYGSNNLKLQALESGVVIDLFPKKIPIMHTANNSFAFLSLYLNYRFGFIRQQYKPDEESAIEILFSE